MPKTTERGAVATSHLHDTKRRDAAQELSTISGIVEALLRESPATRASDKLLIVSVYDRYGVLYEPFYKVMARNDLPSFETITRCRRKVQEEHEELRAVKPVENERISRQVNFIEYAGGNYAG